MSELLSSSPPKVPITFRVGVVGHRPDRLRQADFGLLVSVLRGISETIQGDVQTFATRHQGLYSDAPPKFVAVSPCAEGSDRIFAAQAISLGYALHCPMPFAQDDYEKDFEPPNALEQDSLSSFHQLLNEAKAGSGLSVFELDGDPSKKDVAYRQAGDVVLNQSDVLVVVWDGADAAGTGGTVETMKAAISCRIPVVWVDARSPHGWQVVREESDLPCLRSRGGCTPVQSTQDTLATLVNEILDIPGGSSVSQYDSQPQKWNVTRLWKLFRKAAGIDPRHVEPHQKADVYFKELMPMPKWNVARFWKVFRDVVGDNRFAVPPRQLESVEVIADRDYPATESGVRGWVNGVLGRHFVWADQLADYYADCYRSTYLFAFLGSALAVFLAIFPLWVGLDSQKNRAAELVLAAAELGVLLGISGLILWGKRQQWHDRWMEYRVLAELIREFLLLIPLGGGRLIARPIPHLGGYGKVMETWMSWHARAVERVTGLPSVRVDKAYVRTMLEYLKKVVDGQAEFHQMSYSRHHRIEHRLHNLGLRLFSLTALAVAIHFTNLWVGHESTPGGMGLTTVAAVFLPVVGAALMGIKYQGAFARLAMRNEAMVQGLTQYGKTIDALMSREVPPTSAEVVELTMSVAQLMIDEVVDWRVIALVRPLVPPA